MASTETKLFSRIVLSAAVFISLSVGTASEEARRCYWCGPLAEQVHRSQRALSCSSGNTQVTVCEPGFTHCAIVATSPPHTESRYCVKFYQDECYSLYCNSTKTWRMTCPCRGDLCNGPNTDREDEAFEVLNKLVAKTNNARIKRALITSQFINMNRKKKLSNVTTDERTNNETNDTEAIAINVITQNDVTETIVSPVESIENAANDNEMQSDQAVGNVENTDSVSKTTMMHMDIPKSTIDTKDVDGNIDDKNDNDVTTKGMTQDTGKKDTSTMPTKATEHSNVERKITEIVNSSGLAFPTAEALQHNDTPANKITEKSTVVTTMSTHSEVSTQPNMKANNSATQINTPFLTLAIGIILQY